MSTVVKQQKAKNKDISYYCNLIIVLLFMFGFGYLPPFGELTQLGMHTLGIFIGMLWGWSAIGFIWPSLLGLIAVGLTGFMSIQAAFAAGFSDSSTMMVFFMFVFTDYMNRTGVCRSIACWFISRKIAVGRPWIFVFMLLISSYIIGGSTSPLASTLIGWSVFYEVCEVLGFKKYEKFPVLMIVGIVYAGILGGTVVPFRPIAAVVLNGVNGVTGTVCDPLIFALVGLVVSMVNLVAFVLMCKYIFKPDVKGLASNEDSFAHYRENKMTREEKVAGIALILVLLANFLPSILPASWGITVFLSKFTMTSIFAAVLMILDAVKIKGQGFAEVTAGGA